MSGNNRPVTNNDILIVFAKYAHGVMSMHKEKGEHSDKVAKLIDLVLEAIALLVDELEGERNERQ